MPRRLLGVFILLLVSVSAMQAQGDVALLTIGNEKVDKEEFEYYWSKSSEKNVRVFAQTLGHFMQKIYSNNTQIPPYLPFHYLWLITQHLLVPA